MAKVKRCAHPGCDMRLSRGTVVGVCKEHVHRTGCCCAQCTPVAPRYVGEPIKVIRQTDEVTLPVPPWELRA